MAHRSAPPLVAKRPLSHTTRSPRFTCPLCPLTICMLVRSMPCPGLVSALYVKLLMMKGLLCPFPSGIAGQCPRSETPARPMGSPPLIPDLVDCVGLEPRRHLALGLGHGRQLDHAAVDR